MGTVLIACVVGVALLNVVASVSVIRDAGLTSRQRQLQIALVWLVPFVGALLTFVFRRWTSAVPTVGGSAPALSADVATGLSAAANEHHHQ